MTMANSTAPSPQRSSASVSLRKTNKPLMEKRRRARINDSLAQLKSLVIQSSKKDSSQFNKLEKADILELTVKHLRNLQNQQQQQMAQVASTDPNLAGKYCAGFMECAQEVIRYLKQSQGFSDDTKARVVGHLTSCLQLASQPYVKPAPLPTTAVVASNVMGTVSNSSTAQLANGHVIQIVSNPFQNCKQPTLTTVNQYTGPATVQVAVPVSSAPLQIPVFQQQQPSAVDLPSQTSATVASAPSAVSASVLPTSGTLSNVTSQIQDTSSYIRYTQPLHIQIPPVLSPFLVKADSSSQEPKVMRKHEEPKNNSNPATEVSNNISSSTASPSPFPREINSISRPAQKQLQFYNGNDLQDHFCSRSRTYSVTSSSSSSSESEMSSPLNLSQSPTYSSSSVESSREHSQLRFHSMSSTYGLDKISSAPHSSVKDNVDYCHSNFTSVIVDGRRALEAPTSKYMTMMEDDRHCIRPHGTPSPASSVGEERLWRPW